MLWSLLLVSPIAFLVIAAGIMTAITIHEFAHAWVADRLGDPTPRHQGRVSLNPQRHLDLLGTLTIFTVGFGWGKPVIFDPYNLRKPVRDAALISLAGPVSNLMLSTVLAVLIHLDLLPGMTDLLSNLINLNLGLAIFNLIPVYPLDGSKILLAVLPPDTAQEYEHFMRRYGILVLILLLMPWNGVSPVSRLVGPVIGWLRAILL